MTSTTTAETTIPAYSRDSAGFPVEQCRRCDGTGYRPYSYAGGVCFGCNGSRWTPPKGKPGKLAADWHRMLRTAAEADTSASINCDTGEITCSTKPGDEIRNTYGMAPEAAARVPWRTVERVEIGDLNGGTASVGCWPDGTMRLRSMDLDVTIHYTDGTSEHGGRVMTRRVSPALLEQRDAMAAQARTLYERNLINRERKAQRATAAA